MKHWALNYLACPLTGASLRLQDAQWQGEEIIAGSLVGPTRSYPIVDGVPQLGLDPISADEAQTVAAFGEQWDRFACQDGYMASRELFLDSFPTLSAADFQDRVVLEAGCGNGRWLRNVATLTDRHVIGLDYSSAAHNAWRNTRHLPHVTVVRGSILQPPLVCSAFDLIVSVGVIHHLDNPALGMTRLGELLRRRGRIAIWTYAHEGNELYLRLVAPLRRWCPHLPTPVLEQLSRLLALPVWLHAHTVNRWCGLKGDGSRRLPMAGYFELLRQLRYRDIVNIVHDQLTPQLAHYYRREEVAPLFAAAGLELTNCATPRGNSYSLVGSRAVAKAAAA